MSFENNYTQTLKTKQCPHCSIFVDPSATVCPNDGTSLVERFDRDPVFANYEFLGEIGSGGMGVIYKARQVILNKVVAIKTLHPHLSSPAAFRRFQNEGKATSLLQHPYIVAVHDFGVTQGGQTFMVMDFIDGETLSSLLEREGQLTEKHFLKIFIDVCDAMAHAHSRSVVHRDIKSSNIMIVKTQNGEEEIRIMDFGIAKLIADTESGANQVTRTGEVIGTATCMSPEQARGGKVDHRSDLYALGCVMYEALASCPPFSGNTPLETMLMHLEKRPMPIKQASMGHDVDPQLEAIVFRLLEKEPEKRYQSMNELKADLIALQSSSLSRTKATYKSPGAQASKKINVKVWCGAGLSLAMILIVLFVALKSNLLPSHSPAVVAVTPAIPVQSEEGRESLPLVKGTSSPENSEAKESIMHQLQIDSTTVDVKYAGIDILDSDLTPFEGEFPKTAGVTFSGALVTDAGLQHLHKLTLKRLDLTGTRAKNLDWILSLKNDLGELHLTGTPLTHQGFHNVGQLKELTYLKVDKTNFDDTDVASFSGLQKLRRISVNGTKLSLKGLDALSNSLPNCTDYEYFPSRDVKKAIYAPFTLIPSDSRGTDALLAEAQTYMNDKKWESANGVLERIILDGFSHRTGRNFVSMSTLVASEAMRGICLQNLNLPYAAIHLYERARQQIIVHNIGEWFKVDMEQRIASICETLPGVDNLDKAITSRKVVKESLDGQPNPSLMPQWAILRDINSKQLQRDLVKKAKTRN